MLLRKQVTPQGPKKETMQKQEKGKANCSAQIRAETRSFHE